jgi:hypothetical protein
VANTAPQRLAPPQIEQAKALAAAWKLTSGK